MKNLYSDYQRLNIDGSWIGLAVEEGCEYFCTPLGAQVLGWDNGIHYCLVQGFGDMVFCVNPESCCEHYVYPIARDFRDFLRLLLAAGNTNTLQQIIGWDKNAYDAFGKDAAEQEYRAKPEVVDALDKIRSGLGITPMENPFAYVKELQRDFPYQKIQFSNDYYDTLGLERPDGTEPSDAGFEFRTVEFRFEKK